MENPEGVLILLDEFAKLKSKEIPNDLEEYLLYVAASGDPVYQWSLIKSLYRQKLINVITEFYEMCPVIDIPRCPNVDPFNYETMKNSLLKRLDSFSGAPFTIQRLSELLTTPRKQYNRVDKFMRAIEKNIWVVSTREPGPREPANSQDTSTNLVNGVSPRVSVTVKHPKRIKSIEERMKSGHAQLLDDDEEENDEEDEEMDDYETMEVDETAEMLPNNEVDDSSLQCTSVKNLIEKYENGTIFSNAEQKSVQVEEVSAEATPSTEPVITSPSEQEEEEGKPTPVTEPESQVSESETVQTESEPPVSEIPTETAQTQEDTVPEATSNSFFSETDKEGETPMVAADSSSDVAVQDSEVEEAKLAVGEAVALDSTTDISVEESQPVAESSTSSSEPVMTENTEVVSETPAESSTTDASTSEKEESQPAPETSTDCVTESETNKAGTENESGVNECN